MAYVIVIEDDELALSVIKRNLLVMKHEVLPLTDGLTLVDEIEKRRPELIITDINLPFKNGFELVKEIHEKFGRFCPILGISSTPLSNLSGHEALTHLLDDFIAKPFTKDELTQRITKLL